MHILYLYCLLKPKAEPQPQRFKRVIICTFIQVFSCQHLSPFHGPSDIGRAHLMGPLEDVCCSESCFFGVHVCRCCLVIVVYSIIFMIFTFIYKILFVVLCCVVVQKYLSVVGQCVYSGSYF